MRRVVPSIYKYTGRNKIDGSHNNNNLIKLDTPKNT